LFSSLFSLFGRSKEREQLDLQLRGFGLEPRGLSEALKLTLLRLLKSSAAPADAGGSLSGSSGAPSEAALRQAAALFSYCFMGSTLFAESNGAPCCRQVEARLTAALQAPQDRDAQIILLALYSGMADDELAARFDWE
jgi:hypothetical protein|tara:strand:+ start:10534 stop:10947 length:414 start_codon:yes stop_codon:yes gene_type:complete